MDKRIGHISERGRVLPSLDVTGKPFNEVAGAIQLDGELFVVIAPFTDTSKIEASLADIRKHVRGQNDQQEISEEGDIVERDDNGLDASVQTDSNL